MRALSREMLGYVEVGLAHVARGAKRFSDFSAAMKRDLPHLNSEQVRDIWQKARAIARIKIGDIHGNYYRLDKVDPEALDAIAESYMQGLSTGAIKPDKLTPKSFASVESGAKEYIATHGDDFWQGMLGRKGQLGHEEVHALRIAANDLGIQQADTLRAIQAATDPAEKAVLAEKLAVLRDKQIALAGALTNERTHAGRSLAYWRLTTGNAISKGSLDQIAGRVKGLIGRDLTDSEMKKLAELIARRDASRQHGTPKPGIDTIDLTAPPSRKSLIQISKFLSGLEKRSWWEAGASFIRANLLTAAATHAWNQLSNATEAALQEGKWSLASGLDAASSKLTGTTRASAYTLPTRETLGLWATDTKRRLIETLTGTHNIGLSKYDLSRHKATDAKLKILEPVARAIDAYTDTVQRITSAGDQPYRSWGRIRAAQNFAEVMSRGDEQVRGHLFKLASTEAPLKIETQLESEAVRYASESSEFSVFSNPTVVSEWFRAARRATLDTAEKFGLRGVADLLMTLIAPFERVPTSLAARAVTSSPLGAAAGLTRMARLATMAKRATAAGKTAAEIDQIPGLTPADRRAAAELAAEGLLGTAIWFLGYKVGEAGYLYLASSPQERAKMEVAGLRGTAVKLANTWHDLSRFSPVATILAAGAAAAHRVATSQKRDPNGPPPAVEALMGTLRGGFTSLLEAPMVEGVRNVFRVAESALDPDSGNTAPAGNMVGGWAAATVPFSAGLRYGSRFFDQYARETAGANLGETIKNRVKSGIPGLRETLPPRMDGLGRPVRDVQGVLSTTLRGPEDPLEEAVLQSDSKPVRPKKEAWEDADEFSRRMAALGAARRIAVSDALPTAQMDAAGLAADAKAAADDVRAAGGAEQYAREIEKKKPDPIQQAIADGTAGVPSRDDLGSSPKAARRGEFDATTAGFIPYLPLPVVRDLLRSGLLTGAAAEAARRRLKQ